MAHGSIARACILGDLDLVAPLRLAGIRCAVVTPPGDPARFSRHVEVVGWEDPWSSGDALLRLLLRWAAEQEERPVLFYQTDASALFASEHRDALGASFDLVLPDRQLLGDLLDKLRFRELALRSDLPVPESQVLRPRLGTPVPAVDDFPVLVKPATRGDPGWGAVEAQAKAVRVDDLTGLARVWDRLCTYGTDVLLQRIVPGPETAIESYHCYVDALGGLVADFTGRKLRTRPQEFGHTTALEITDEPSVKELGRHVVQTLGLRGVAKVDLKRAPDGRLWLLEINPRFNLWHHPAALAGVNLPAMVWADLRGLPRPPLGEVKVGTAWCSSWDLQAAREWQVPLREWAAFARRCEARSMLSATDPGPTLRLAAQRTRRLLRRRPPAAFV